MKNLVSKLVGNKVNICTSPTAKVAFCIYGFLEIDSKTGFYLVRSDDHKSLVMFSVEQISLVDGNTILLDNP